MASGDNNDDDDDNDTKCGGTIEGYKLLFESVGVVWDHCEG